MAAEQPAKPQQRRPVRPEARPAWLPANYKLADATALQALAAGTADATQQKRALTWIVNEAAGTYDLSYRPGEGGDRETAFAEGRRFVGSQIVKMLKISVAALRRRAQSDDASEHG